MNNLINLNKLRMLQLMIFFILSTLITPSFKTINNLPKK